jgi:hypothetical protein
LAFSAVLSAKLENKFEESADSYSEQLFFKYFPICSMIVFGENSRLAD